MTSVFVTHDQDEALELADRVVVMNEGRIEQIGTPDDVFHQPGQRVRGEVPGQRDIAGGCGQRQDTTLHYILQSSIICVLTAIWPALIICNLPWVPR